METKEDQRSTARVGGGGGGRGKNKQENSKANRERISSKQEIPKAWQEQQWKPRTIRQMGKL